MWLVCTSIVLLLAESLVASSIRDDMLSGAYQINWLPMYGADSAELSSRDDMRSSTAVRVARPREVQPLNEIDELMNGEDKQIQLQLKQGCSFQLKKESNMLTLSKTSCLSPPEIDDFIEIFALSDVNIEEKTEGIISPDKLIVNSLAYDHNEKTVSLKCESSESSELYGVIDRYVSLTSTKVTLIVPIENELSFTEMEIEIKGQFDIKGQDSPTTFKKPAGTKTLTVDVETNFIDAADWTSPFGVRIGSMTTQEVGFNTAKFATLSFQTNPTVKGTFTKGIGFQFLVYDNVTDSAAFSSAKVFFIISKSEEMAHPSAAFVNLITPKHGYGLVNPSALLKRFLNYEVTDVPLFKAVSKPYVMIVADGDIPLSRDVIFKDAFKEIMREGDLYNIPAGVHIRIFLPIKSALKNCDRNADISQLTQDEISMGFEIQAFGIKHSYPPNLKVDAKALLLCLDPSIKKELPSVVFGEYKFFDIKEFTYNRGAGTRKASFRGHVIFPGTLIVKPDVLEFTGLEIIVDNTAAGEWTFTASTSVNIRGIEAAITIEKSSDTFVFSAMFEKITTDEIKKMLGINDERSSLAHVILEFLKLEIHHFRFEATLGNQSEFRFSGSPIIRGMDRAGMEGLVWKINQPTSAQQKRTASRGREGQQLTTGFAMGVVIRNIRIDEILKTVLGVEFPVPGWLTDLTAVLLYSNADRNPETEEGSEDSESQSVQRPPGRPAGNTLQRGPAIRRRNRSTEDELKRAKRKMEEADKKKSDNSQGNQAEDNTDDDEKVGMQILELGAIEIKKGVTMQALYEVPREQNLCGESVICKFLFETLGNSYTMLLEVRLDGGEVHFSGTISMVLKLTENVRLTEISLAFVKRGLLLSVSISAELKMNSPALTFSGKIEVDISGTVELSFDMAGKYENAFNMKYLSIGALHLGVGYTRGAPSFEFGGVLFLGEPGCGKEIQIQIYVGFDPLGNDKYFFGKIGEATLGTIADAFDLDMDASSKMKDSGFPRGLLVSWTANQNGIDLEAHDIRIQYGLRIEGTLNIVGYEVDITIEIKKDDGIDVLFIGDFDPLDIKDGLLVLRKSKADKDKGPCIRIHIAKRTFDVEIHAYVYVLGIEAQATIVVSDQGFTFGISGNLFGILSASVHIEATFGNLAAASFKFEGCIIVDLRKISDAIKEILERAKERAQKAIKDAQDSVTRAQEKVRIAQDVLTRQRARIRTYEENLARRLEILNEQKKEMEQACNNTCGDTCIPFFGWNPNCFQFFGYWCGCPTWNPCFKKVKDMICMAACELKNVGRKILIWGERTGIQVMLGFTEVGKLLLSAIEGVVQIGQNLLVITQGVLTFARIAVSVGLQITAAIAEHSLTSIRIHRFCLSASLDDSREACAGMEFKATIFRYEIDINKKICVNLNIYSNMARNAVDEEYPGLSKEDEELEKLQGKFAETKEQEDEFENENSNVNAEVNREITDPATSKRTSVPTAEEMKFIKASEASIPQYFIKNDDIMKAYQKSAPWFLIDDAAASVTKEPNINSVKAHERSDIAENSGNTCGQLRSAINKYDSIAEGVRLTTESIKRQKIMWKKEKQRMLNGVQYLKNQVDETEKRHNLTVGERQDLYFWYNEMKAGTEDWIKKSRHLVSDIDKRSIVTMKSQMNDALKASGHSNVRTLVKDLHLNATNAFRRSDVARPDAKTGEVHLKQISGLLESMFTKSATPKNVLERSRKLDSHLDGMKRFTIACS